MPENKNLKCYELVLNYSCNARCSFCSQGAFDRSLNADFGTIAGNIYSAYKDGYRRLGLTGGEPLIRPDILKIVALGRSVGFGFIRVQTNGIRLADPAFCAALVKAGLTFCKFSFTSDIPDIHDRLVGVPGAWAKAVKGLENLRALKVRLGTNIVVNRLNYRRLPEIISRFLEKGLSNFVVIYPVYAGGMAAHAGTIGVSLPAAGKYFLKTAELMEQAGLAGEILFLNTPPCFLNGRENLAIGLDLFNTVVTGPDGARTDLDLNADAAKVYGAVCRACALKRRCKGVDANYARLLGFRGFKPVERGPAAPGAAKAGGKLFFSDNELCLLEILKLKKEVSTAEALRLSKTITLCRDCSDGNAVLNSAHSLMDKGRVTRRFSGGKFYWSIKKRGPF
ncbi:MAG: radical SAM protein [Elusimicrobiales bacterium]|jgi:MoaA/NifB/PqqE/SkfB family radical SAM enzyme